MTLPDWQKRDWVDVPPGTTAPTGAPARDAAWHTALDDFLGLIPGEVAAAAETGGGGSARIAELPIGDVFLPDSEISSATPYLAQVFKPRVGDLAITGVRVPFTFNENLGHSVVIRYLEDFQEAIVGYARSNHLVALQDFVGEGNAEQIVMFDAAVPLVAGSVYEVGVGVDQSVSRSDVAYVPSDLPYPAISGVALSGAAWAETRSGIRHHNYEGFYRPALSVLCEQTGTEHVNEPFTITDPYAEDEAPADDPGQLTPYLLSSTDFAVYAFFSYTFRPLVNLTLNGALAELTPTGELAITLYDSAGGIIEQSVFAGDGADQTISFASPASLIAGTTYELAYHASTDGTIGLPDYRDMGPSRGNSDIEIIDAYHETTDPSGAGRTASPEQCGRMKLLYSV